MKTNIHTASTVHSNFGAEASKNVMEGAPSGLAGIKAQNSVSVTERPHILLRRTARWARRANH